MDKSQLREGADYGFRENTRAWEKEADTPERVTYLGRGNLVVRFPDGREAEVKSRQLVAFWNDVPAKMETEAKERAFRSHTIRSHGISSPSSQRASRTS